jgi:hypothetical protein
MNMKQASIDAINILTNSLNAKLQYTRNYFQHFVYLAAAVTDDEF